VVTILGLYLGNLIGNSVMTEIVFKPAGPRQAHRRRAQSARLHDAARVARHLHELVVVVNVVTDVAYGVVDPRVKLQ